MVHPFKIEADTISVLNDLIPDLPSAVWVRKVLDECRLNGVPIIVTDVLGFEIGSVIGKEGDHYVWGRTPGTTSCLTPSS